MELVKEYAGNEGVFFEQFANSMVKMGNISPLTGSNGEIRKNCRQINNWWGYNLAFVFPVVGVVWAWYFNLGLNKI